MKKLQEIPPYICNEGDESYVIYSDTDSIYIHAHPLLKHKYPNFDELPDNEKDKKTVSLECIPKIGRGSFFYSQQWHEGAKIEKGYKYLLRTDLMINHNKKI